MSDESGSGRCYVDNAMNRRLGRVGMPLGSMVVSRGSSASSSGASYFGSSVSDSGRTYVDNYVNRGLGRVGMPLGSMVVSNRGHSGSLFDDSNICYPLSDSQRVYVDNSMNHWLGRVGMPLGSMVVSSRRHSTSLFDDNYIHHRLLDSERPFLDSSINQSQGRIDMPVGSMMVPRKEKSAPFPSYNHSDSSSSANVGEDFQNTIQWLLEKVKDESKSASLSCSESISQPKNYEDNKYNLGQEACFLTEPRGENRTSTTSACSRESSASSQRASNLESSSSYNKNTCFDDAIYRNLGQADIPIGTKSVLESKSRSLSSSKTYVDNEYNRRLGRVGLEHGSMVVSKDSGVSSSKETKYYGDNPNSRSSSKTYVDNEYNRRLGRVGLEHGSMVVTKDSGISSSKETKYYGDNPNSRSSSSSKTYVDNEYNRRLGRVGLEHGSMVVSKDSGISSSKETKYYGDNPKSRSSSSSKTYVDNEYNRRLGRTGLEHGSMVVSKESRSGGSSGTKRYVDNSTNRKLGRVGLPYGVGGEDVRLYKDNPLNRRLGRVGLPIGTAIKSKYGSNVHKYYADNAENRRLERVGFPLGSRPKGSFAKSKRTYCDNYLNRRYGRVGKELGTEPVNCRKKREWIYKVYKRLKENPDEDIDFETFPTLSHGEEEDAVEQLEYMFNRLQLKNEWQKKEEHTSPVPKTSDYLLHYTGPVIDFSEIKLVRIIGSGGFGKVYYGKYKDSIVAVKMLHVKEVNKRLQIEFFDEVNILSKLDNPFIVKFIGACTEPPNLCIVMEYMQMSLHEALHVGCADMNDLTDDDRLMMIIQTLSGLDYLHDKNVAHCDIKPGNILIDHDGEKFTVAKLSDFGLSMMKNDTETSLSSDDRLVCHIGTPIYSSPERLRGEYLNLKQMKMSDMYSYGLVVFEILCGIQPFCNFTSLRQLQIQVGLKNMYPKFPDDIHPNVHLAAKLLGCWDRKPENRPTATGFLRVMNRISCVYETMD